jgi:rod shape-determining protein MreC
MATPGQLMFARGLRPTTRLILWIVVGFSLALMDVRWNALDVLRAGFSQVMQPVQRAILVPFDVAAEISGYLVRHRELQQQRDKLLDERIYLTRALYAARDAERVNTELRSLLKLTGNRDRKAVAAHILYQGQDWFSRRMTIDRGASSGIQPGSPVIDAQGLVGQVTRVYRASSEVTLVTNSDQLTPVFVERTGQRALAAGGSEADQLELRFMPVQTDIKPGDQLLTSGIDKVYPAGLPVARVVRISPPEASPYARVECIPLAGVNRDRALLVLSAIAPQP